MKPISNMISGTAARPAAVDNVKEPPKVQRPEDDSKERLLKPVTDEYIPEKKEDPAGRYWLGKDQDGKPKIYFDNPEQKADSPQAAGSEEGRKAAGPEPKVSEDKDEKTCTANTDKVDREIEKLKKKQKELKSQLNSETDETKIEALKKQLAQVENELRQKDNDTYRRQHTEFSFS